MAVSCTRLLVTFTVIIISVCYKLIQRPTIPEVFDASNAEYKGVDLESPLLYGTPLKVFANLLKVPVISSFISGMLYRINEYHIVRDFGYHLDFMPRYIPRRLVTDSEYEQHTKMAQSKDFKSILKADLNNVNKILGKNTNTANKELWTVERIIESYASKKKTPLDIIQQSLAAVDELDGRLHIFAQLNRDEVLQQARESTQRWKENKPLSMLDGVPIAVKDEYHVKGYNTTFGTSFMDKLHGESTREELIVSRVRALGAIIFGKTNMHEIGLFPMGYNSRFGAARNPYSQRLIHDTGGSSSGSSVAVSSGIVPLAFGGDGGGSIRIPSAYNGLVGLKGTFGRIPYLPQGAAWSCLSLGFLANTVRDQAIGYAAIAGYEPDEEGDVIMHPQKSLTNPPVHLYDFDKIEDLSDLTIGVYWDWFLDSQQHVHEAGIDMINTLVNKYHAKLVNVTIPYLHIMGKAHTIMILSEWIEGDYKYVNTDSIKGSNQYSYVDATMGTLLFAMNEFDIVDLLSSMKIRNWLMDYFETQIFNKIDILVTPMTPITAPKYERAALETGASVLDTRTVARSCQFAFLGNFIGIPGITVPIGYSKYDGNGELHEDGSSFPISMQFMANHWEEHKLFRVANLIEQKLVKRQLPPKQNRYTYT